MLIYDSGPSWCHLLEDSPCVEWLPVFRETLNQAGLLIANTDDMSPATSHFC